MEMAAIRDRMGRIEEIVSEAADDIGETSRVMCARSSQFSTLAAQVMRSITEKLERLDEVDKLKARVKALESKLHQRRKNS